MKSALARQTKENSAYFRDSGFHSSARLMDSRQTRSDQLTPRRSLGRTGLSPPKTGT